MFVQSEKEKFLCYFRYTKKNPSLKCNHDHYLLIPMYKQMNNLLDGTLCSNEIIAVEKQTLISNRVL